MRQLRCVNFCKNFPAAHLWANQGLTFACLATQRLEDEKYRGSGKLQNKVALITGGDSGIGRAVAIAFAKEGADVAVVYLEEHKDARETAQLVEQRGRKCVLIDGDVGDENFCQEVVKQTIDEFGKIDILVNNAAE